MSRADVPAGVPMRPCKACSRTITFARTPEGQQVPLDVSAPTYRLTVGPDGSPVAERAGDVFVSHFATCPSAGQFSRSKKAAS